MLVRARVDAWVQPLLALSDHKHALVDTLLACALHSTLCMHVCMRMLPCPAGGLARQDVTVRELYLELWGGECGYQDEATNTTFPGQYLGAARAVLSPSVCFSVLEKVVVPFGAEPSKPRGAVRLPPLDWGTVRLDGANTDDSIKKATEQEIVSYLTVRVT